MQYYKNNILGSLVFNRKIKFKAILYIDIERVRCINCGYNYNDIAD